MADALGEAGPRRIPEATVVRLPIYQRLLSELCRSGQSTVSSEQLAELAGVNAAKVRKDLSHLGSFGTRGTGYDTAFLLAQMDRALGVDLDWPVGVVGIGNLGRALVNSAGFSSHGFRVAALFDSDPSVVGTRIGSTTVQSIDVLPTLTGPDVPAIGVVATPATAAQEVTNALVGIGVRSILNFAPTVLSVPAHVLLRYVDLSIELQVMSFYQRRHRTAPVAGIAPLRSVGVAAGGAEP
jgi:redox-sensing transcriptional repressor